MIAELGRKLSKTPFQQNFEKFLIFIFIFAAQMLLKKHFYTLKVS